MKASPLPLFLLSIAAAATGCTGGSSSAPGTVPGALVNDVLSVPYTGTKSVLFLIVEFEDQPALFPTTADGLAQVEALRASLSDAYDTYSYGKLALEIDFTWPPIRIPKNVAEYDPSEKLVRLRTDAVEAAQSAGWAPETYDREVLFYSDPPHTMARGWTRTAWMPHKLAAVLHHELGHTLGWGHSDFLPGDPTAAEGTINRGDIYDTMGSGLDDTTLRHAAPFLRLRAGWLSESMIERVTLPGRYTLTALEDPVQAEGPVALVVRRDADNEYWIFHRSALEEVRDGVLIVRVQSNPFLGNPLLDMHPGTAVPLEEEQDAELLAAEVFDDSAASGIVITNATELGGPVTVDIALDETRQAGLDMRPLIEVLAPSQEAASVSGVVEFAAAAADPSVGDHDGEGIGKIRFEILATTVEPFPVVAGMEVFARPYVWAFDTTSLDDTTYYLAVTAEALDGGERTIWARFLVDNGSLAGD